MARLHFLCGLMQNEYMSQTSDIRKTLYAV